MQEQSLECLTLALVPGLGTTRLHQLLKQWGSPAEVIRRSRQEGRKMGLEPEFRAYLSSGCARRNAEEAVQTAGRLGIELISVYDDAYPFLLKQIFDPPLILYCQGDLSVLRRPSIAVVGSRRCSVYGRGVTLRLARELAEVGLTIVSGLARGVDSQAHQGALEAGGTTVAVLGCGVDVVYPRENRRLYQQIGTRGCVISEFHLGSFPAPQNFPIRNRIISGLGYGTLITEAGEFSGSLITARLTLEQNRELWAVPGNITSPGSYGPNYLLKQGAQVTLAAQDVLDTLPPYVLEFLRSEARSTPPDLPVEEWSSDEQQVLSRLQVDAAIHFDRLLRDSGMPLPRLHATLLALELKGAVQQLPGKQFCRLGGRG